MKHFILLAISFAILVHAVSLRLEFGDAGWWAVAIIPSLGYLLFSLSDIWNHIDKYKPMKRRR
jgi:hypothetical protein